MGNVLPRKIVQQLPKKLTSTRAVVGANSSPSWSRSKQAGLSTDSTSSWSRSGFLLEDELVRELSYQSDDDSVQAECFRAAKAILDCDVFLLCTGTGFTADSGLPLCREIAEIAQYRSRGLTYTSICDTCWMDTDLTLFYGYWGTCLNDARWTRPHAGYEILASWRDRFFHGTALSAEIQRRCKIAEKNKAEKEAADKEEEMEPLKGQQAGAFFVFTSNMDSHLLDYFDAGEVRESHGSVEFWQCGSVCSKRVWRAPSECTFRVDLRNMLAFDPPGTNMTSPMLMKSMSFIHEVEMREERRFGKRGHEGMRGDRFLQGLPPSEDASGSGKMFWRPNRPVCPLCKAPARPNVLMFSDLGWVDNAAQERRWSVWLQTVKDECQLRRSGPELKVVIMEIGAGATTVPTVRSTSQSVAARLEQLGARATLVRINPEKCRPDGAKGARLKHFIGIPLRGLEALERINAVVEARLLHNRSFARP
uniref:Deacetylase sirtuin-type domain-containing protein n=1 Tax=Alexandrium monilatum TaxID=311494 RepID=A0A7S4UG17_9DINO|mmetsp:Transcript_85826/g.265742  ORF Transcript_85826/g.265742 Transcript_85826/m.265742 type:complete len:478 (+) Transcript_85826:61-1494(+)